LKTKSQAGFTLIELLVGATIMLMVLAGVTGLLIRNSRLNKSQHIRTTVQSDVRSCVAMIVQALRSAGWDPAGATFAPVVLDSDPNDGVSEIEVFADLDGDGFTTGPDEQILIRHVADRIEWRRGVSGSFEILAVDISNDADDDGTVEPLFVPNPTTDPTSILVRVTGESPVPDPLTGQPHRYTVASEVALRKHL
jgi:prepilin-type N-terminal cleavage/methylation domain-containing protein